MSGAPSSSASLSDASCRILTVSSSLDQAISFIDRIRNLGKETSSTVHESEPILSEEQTFDKTATIPWTLSNKYYQADVHFHAREVKGFAPYHTSGVPAIIFVWSHGQSYRDDAARIASDMSASQPDVALAVRLPRPPSSEDDDEEFEEESEIDEFFSSHGFEFIDGQQLQRDESTDDEGHGLSHHGIPGLPRVIDSLSTIMWPSIKTKAQSKPKFSRQRINLFPRSGSSRLDSLRLHKEAEDLVRWLEDDVSLRELVKNDPWKSISEPGTVCTSPTSLEKPTAPWALPSRGNAKSLLGFDDDFTEFISAPRDSSSGHSTPQARSPTATHDTSFEAEGLRSPFSSSLYRALGSAANLQAAQEGEEEGEQDDIVSKQTDVSDDDDEDLPTRQEIAATAARIFGTDKSTHPSSVQPDASSILPTSSLFAVDSLASQEPSSMQVADLYDVGQFDLSRVLDALRGMKAEIASMTDEGERRRAAARVALGLVYGLEAEGGEEETVYT